MILDFGDIVKRAIPWFPRYRDFGRFLRESDHWTGEQLREFQFYELKAILRHAYANCPFYRKRFDQAGFRPSDFTDFKQLEAIPVLTRAEVASHGEELRSEDFWDFGGRQLSTSGTSTGTPLSFGENWGASFAEHIFMNNLWGRIGYSENDRKVVLRGNVVVSKLNPRPWRKTEGALYLSMYHLTPLTAREYVELMRRYRPEWMHIYPSALVFLIQLLGETVARNELGSLGIRGVFCGSEKLYDWQRELIQRTVQARVLSWYGMTEKVVLAGECERCRSLHVYPQYGYLETIPDHDNHARVIATGFLNYATPFIRYEVGDRIVLGANRCEQCGRNFPLIEEVLGREADFIITRNGVLPFSFSVASIHSDAWSDVAEWQMLQEQPGRLRVLIVPTQADKRASIEHKIRHEMQRRFQDALEVDIEWLTRLPRTSAGKFQYFVQTLDVGGFAAKRTPVQPSSTSAMPSAIRHSELPTSRAYSYFDTTYPELNKMMRGGIRYLLFTRQFQWRSPQEIREYQLQKLRLILDHAYRNIPFYRERFGRAGFEPGDLKSLDDLQRLPLLQKQDVRDHFWEMFDPAQRKHAILCQTSGTTGEPLRFLLSREQVWMEWASIIRCWVWIGYRPYDRVAAFRHYEPGPGEPICRYERRTNTLFFSVFDMDERHLPDYVREFNRFGPKVVRGYPSSIYILASFAKEKRLQLHSPDAIITSSETLLPQYRALIEEMFDCPVYDWYGTNERVVTACQCELRRAYHISAGTGIAEYLDLDAHETQPGDAKSLVVTTLINTAMPLIRYKVGDLVQPESGICECGRGLPLIRSVRGRLDDILVTSDGRYVSPVRFYVLFQEFDMVRQFQIVQQSPDEVLVRLNCLRELNAPESRLLRDKLGRLLGDRVRVAIETVDEIQPERSGKIRNVVAPRSRFTPEPATATS